MSTASLEVGFARTELYWTGYTQKGTVRILQDVDRLGGTPVMPAGRVSKELGHQLRNLVEAGELCGAPPHLRAGTSCKAETLPYAISPDYLLKGGAFVPGRTRSADLPDTFDGGVLTNCDAVLVRRDPVGGTVLGLAVITLHERRGYAMLDLVCTLREQTKGTGRELCTLAHALAYRIGASTMRAEVLHRVVSRTKKDCMNGNARHLAGFYLSMGYEILENANGDDDYVLMERSLP